VSGYGKMDGLITEFVRVSDSHCMYRKSKIFSGFAVGRMKPSDLCQLSVLQKCKVPIMKNKTGPSPSMYQFLSMLLNNFMLCFYKQFNFKGSICLKFSCV
jgi:hypothetical protein